MRSTAELRSTAESRSRTEIHNYHRCDAGIANC